MIQQFLSPPGNEELSSQDNFKERLGLSLQIIRKMQYDVHPTGNLKSRSLTLTQNLVSRNPLIEQFKDVWNTVVEHGWVPVRAAQVIESLLHAGGPAWLAKKLVEEMLKCKYKKVSSESNKYLTHYLLKLKSNLKKGYDENHGYNICHFAFGY